MTDLSFIFLVWEITEKPQNLLPVSLLLHSPTACIFQVCFCSPLLHLMLVEWHLICLNWVGVLLLNSLIKRFVPTNFREMAHATQLDVRPESSLRGTEPLFEFSLVFSKALAVKFTFENYQGSQWDYSRPSNLTCRDVFKYGVVFTEQDYIQSWWFLHLPDNFMSSNDIPVFTASAKHLIMFLTAPVATSASLCKVQMVWREGSPVQRLKVAHFCALIFVSLNLRWNFHGLKGSSYIKSVLLVILFKLT